MNELDQLYKKQILEEAKIPFHFEKRDEVSELIKAYNPICGDRFDLYIDEDDLFFHGYGCTISKASTSFMIRNLSGKSREDSLAIVDEFLNAIGKDLKIDLPYLNVFENTSVFKGRIDCILLPWLAIKEQLDAM